MFQEISGSELISFQELIRSLVNAESAGGF